MAALLPGWVIDDRESVRREARPYRDMGDQQRLSLLAAACRGAARILRARDDRDRALEYIDPLPDSSIAALKRLREKATSRTSPQGSREDKGPKAH